MSAAVESLASRVRAGETRALARAISLVENDDPAGWRLVRELYPHTGRAAVVGLTGSPGAGKSTLIAALVARLQGSTPPGGGPVDRPVVTVPGWGGAR